MLAHELREYIIDNDKIQYLLEEFGCHGFKEHDKDYRCGLPNDPSTTKVSIYKDSLVMRMFTSTDGTSRGDIFTLCMKIFNISFPEANKKIHEILGLKYRFKTKKKEIKDDPLAVFKKYRRRKRTHVNEVDFIAEEDMFDNCIPYPHIDWIREGIMPWTCEEFKIAYNLKRSRIVIPHMFWDGTKGDFIGCNARTTVENFEIFDIPKYWLTPGMKKHLNVYALRQNYAGIQEAGYVVIFESEKSPLKRHSLGDKTGVAISGHEISDEQVKILMSLNVEIIVAMDKDVKLEAVMRICDKFKYARKTSYIWDSLGILGEKDSPCDKGDKVYQALFKRRIFV